MKEQDIEPRLDGFRYSYFNRRDRTERDDVIELSLDGFRYSYRVYPNPESNLAPVVMLGGIFQSVATWTKYIEYINLFAPVILVDPPGSGDSDPLPVDYGVDFLAAALLKVLTTEGVPRANVIAYSYSTPVGYRFSQLYPDKVNRLVLIGAVKEILPDQIEIAKASLALLQEQRIKEFVNIAVSSFTRQELPQAINKCRLVARVLRYNLLKLSLEHQHKYQQNILRWLNQSPLDLTDTPDVSALIFTGHYDHFTKAEHCREIAKSFSNAVYTTVQSADHLVHLQQFQTTMELIMNFFMGLSLDSVANCNPIEYFSTPMLSELAA